MDKKQMKEEKKRQKMEKFLSKKTENISVSKKSTPTGGYNPSEIETKWYKIWEENEYFKPRDAQEKFVITMPPPNVTGSLHIGHSMMIAIQDCLVRYKRMKGYEVLYLPGTDHAGIATQSVVSKQLAKEKKEVDRDGFLKAAWEWKNKYGGRIFEQFKRLGASADFSKQKFTMDEGMSKAVIEAFVQLYEKGLIYREAKIVNWCAKLKTTLSDLEVNHEVIKPNTFIKVDDGNYEFGVIYQIKYPLYNGQYVEIQTTRPETILGDTALCANPKDERYKNIHKAINPLTSFEIPVIYDDHTSMDFGTGLLKITPAHDPVDFEIGKRHGLEKIVIFDNENKINIEGPFYGLKRFEARKKVIEVLKEKGLFVKKVAYEQTLPICSRSGDIIEPTIKEQWWCKCQEMGKKALDAVKSGKIEIHPPEAGKIWSRWLENIRDWCLSRQLWWGHRIPAWKSPSGKWCIGRTKEEAVADYYKKNKCDGKCGSGGKVDGRLDDFNDKVDDNKLNDKFDEISDKVDDKYESNDKDENINVKNNDPIYSIDNFTQDEDVLDTWFSSGLWLFATMGWPKDTLDFQKYFPGSILETGSDILFFWVARMVMMSLELTGSIPFKQILLHGIVRDAHGRKMSKSLGNVIDPLFVIDGSSLEKLIEVMKNGNLASSEIKFAEKNLKNDFPNGITKCGADALRFTLLSYTLGMKDINLDISRVEGYRRLCNKLWNASKFCKMLVGESVNSKEDTTEDIMRGITKDTKRGTTEDIMRGTAEETTEDIVNSSVYTEQELFNLINYSPVIQWIISKRNKAVRNSILNLEKYNFMIATQTIHQFFLYDFCDVFIEVVKNIKNSTHTKVLLTIFLDILKIFHPYLPFITEELFSQYSNETIMYSSYPQEITKEDIDETQFEKILDLVKILRDKKSKTINFLKGTIKDSDLEYIRSLVKKTEINLVEILNDDPQKEGDVCYEVIN